MDRSILEKYKNQEERILISKILDKLKFCETRNKIETTDFLDMAQINLVNKFLKIQKVENYFFTGGYEGAERKILVIYPKKVTEFIENINLNEYICALRLILPNDLKGKYLHKNYLGGVIKLGIKREKIGDILVDENGADILISPDIEKFLITNITELTRFSKVEIEKIDLANLREIKTKTEIIKVTVSSMRLDNIVAELAKCSRGKVREILQQAKVLVNYETVCKYSKEIKENDIITIRGKGRFVIKNILGNSKKGKIIVKIEKFS